MNLREFGAVRQYVRSLPRDWRGYIYPPELKQAVVDFLSEYPASNLTYLCEEWGIPYITVQNWKRKGRFASQGTVVRYIPHEKPPKPLSEASIEDIQLALSKRLQSFVEDYKVFKKFLGEEKFKCMIQTISE